MSEATRHIRSLLGLWCPLHGVRKYSLSDKATISVASLLVFAHSLNNKNFTVRRYQFNCWWPLRGDRFFRVVAPVGVRMAGHHRTYCERSEHFEKPFSMLLSSMFSLSAGPISSPP